MAIGLIGCGVIGLTTGIRLLENGHDVQIVARQTSPTLVSDVAAAFWLPYRVQPRERVLRWAKFSREVFEKLKDEPTAGVSLVPITHFAREGKPDIWWSSLVADYRELLSSELHAPYVSGSTYTTFLIESPQYMPYLRNRFESLGGEISIEEVKDIRDLADRFKIVVNCSGVGAYSICGDPEVFPIRGQVLRLTRPTSLVPSILDTEGVFIVCRSSDCIIGGANVDGDWSLEVRDEARQTLLMRSAILSPALAEAEIIEDLVGLRPGRSSVRVETERVLGNLTVVHNYGHGGAGYTLSWGCAAEVAEMVKAI